MFRKKLTLTCILTLDISLVTVNAHQAPDPGPNVIVGNTANLVGTPSAQIGYDETFVYDTNQREIRSQLTLPQKCERIFAATFSSCGDYLAAGTWWDEGMKKMSICLWETETGKHIVEFKGHVSDIQDIAISPDNKILATASYDGSILLWDLTPYISPFYGKEIR